MSEESGPEPRVENLPLDQLRPYEKNPRSHSLKQVSTIKRSIKDYGFNSAIVVDENNVILAGHGRYDAARALGLAKVPVLKIVHLSEDQKRAYRIADNQTALLAEWHVDNLNYEFGALKDAGFDLVSSTAMPTAEIDYYLGKDVEANGPDVEPEDELPKAKDAPVVSKLGDRWFCGDHAIIVGDMRAEDVRKYLMQRQQAAMVFTDPPYNVRILGFAGGKGKHKHEEFEMGSGEMSDEDFSQFLREVLALLRELSRDGAILYVCMDWRHIEQLLAAGRAADLRLMNLITWVKSNAGMGSFYRSRHELIPVFKSGEAAHINNFELGQNGRNRTNVWEYRGANAFGPTRDDDLASHPTVKPAQMVADAIKDVSNRGDLVLDPFGGSGTTMIAAEMTGRRARLIEISPAYVDLTVRRWEKATGEKARHAITGKLFQDCEADAAENAEAEHD